MSASRRLSCSVHGLAVRLRCSVSSLDDACEHLLKPFLVDEWPEGFIPVDGTIQPYESAEVMHQLPESARRFGTADGSLELYVDGQRFWQVDDRWGMCQIDFESGQWKSWVLPAPTISPLEIAELALLWPMAQLLRSRGLYFIPAISIARDEWGCLLICSAGMEPEMSALIDQGFHVIGQSWTALREEDGGVAMMHVPGHLERGMTHRHRPRGASLTEPAGWVDLVAEAPNSSKNHAFCRSVILVEGSRRPTGWIRPTSPNMAADVLRSRWPMVELRGRSGDRTAIGSRMIARLAEICPTFEMRLSRNPAEAVDQIEAIRSTGSPQFNERRALIEAMPPINLTPWSIESAEMSKRSRGWRLRKERLLAS